MKRIDSLTVKYHGRVVGTVAETRGGLGAFQYDKEWLRDGFSISPLSLPLGRQAGIPYNSVNKIAKQVEEIVAYELCQSSSQDS